MISNSSSQSTQQVRRFNGVGPIIAAMFVLLGSFCAVAETAPLVKPPKPQQKPTFEGALSNLLTAEQAVTFTGDIAEQLGQRLPGTKPFPPESQPEAPAAEPDQQVASSSNDAPITTRRPAKKPAVTNAAANRPSPERSAPRQTASASAAAATAPSSGARVPTWARTKDPAACKQALRALGAEFSPINPIYGRMGCQVENAIELKSAGGAQLKPSAKLNCAMALKVARWAKDAQVSAAQIMADRIETIHHMSAYSCRRRGSGKLSEHAYGNAFDLGSLTLKNSGRTSVLKHWYSDGTPAGGARAGFWRSVAKRGCERFALVLSPVSNAAHKNHLHFDLGRWSKCEI